MARKATVTRTLRGIQVSSVCAWEEKSTNVLSKRCHLVMWPSAIAYCNSSLESKGKEFTGFKRKNFA